MKKQKGHDDVDKFRLFLFDDQLGTYRPAWAQTRKLLATQTNVGDEHDWAFRGKFLKIVSGKIKMNVKRY